MERVHAKPTDHESGLENKRFRVWYCHTSHAYQGNGINQRGIILDAQAAKAPCSADLAFEKHPVKSFTAKTRNLSGQCKHDPYGNRDVQDLSDHHRVSNDVLGR